LKDGAEEEEYPFFRIHTFWLHSNLVCCIEQT
jgi:hypothetical protein